MDRLAPVYPSRNDDRDAGRNGVVGLDEGLRFREEGLFEERSRGVIELDMTVATRDFAPVWCCRGLFGRSSLRGSHGTVFISFVDNGRGDALVHGCAHGHPAPP